MVKMLFVSQQPKVTIVPLPNKMYDVTVLDNEEIVTMEPPDIMQEEPQAPQTAYQYDGNAFRTVYELTREEILADMEKWLNYSTKDEPTVAQLTHDNELTDKIVMELIEGGIL